MSIYTVVYVIDSSTQVIDDIAEDFIVNPEDNNKEKGRLYMPFKDILEFKEMNPPDLMPQVGLVIYADPASLLLIFKHFYFGL